MAEIGSDARDPAPDVAPDAVGIPADALIPLDDEPLNFIERMLARLSTWAGALVGRWDPAFGPFFTSDGRLAAGREMLLDGGADETAEPPNLDE